MPKSDVTELRFRFDVCLIIIFVIAVRMFVYCVTSKELSVISLAFVNTLLLCHICDMISNPFNM